MPFLCMRTALGVVGIIVSALALTSCSVFGDEPYPKAEYAFFFTAQPNLTCDPECGWEAESELVAKADSSYGGRITPFVVLELPDRTFQLRGIGMGAADLPLVAGRSYRFEADVAAFGLVFPNPTAFRVSDDDGLAFYAVSASALPGTDTTGVGFDRVLLLPEGWALRFEDTGRKAEVGCGTATAYTATVEHDGSRIRLLQGERGRLGDYEVQVRVSNRMLYDGSCIDGYSHEFSMVIARRAA